MCRLPNLALGIVSATLILLPELAAPLFHGREESLPLAVALTVLAGNSLGLMVYFPALPWLGITLVGVLMGRFLAKDSEPGWRIAGLSGILAILIALLIRWNGGFGNLGVIEGQGWSGFFSFVKYSPSLAYVGWNAGLILLSWPALNLVDQKFPDLTRIGTVYGRSALFFYLAHLAIYACVSRILGPPEQSLAVALVIWLLGLTMLWPLCRLYSCFKRSKAPDSWFRFF